MLLTFFRKTLEGYYTGEYQKRIYEIASEICYALAELKAINLISNFEKLGERGMDILKSCYLSRIAFEKMVEYLLSGKQENIAQYFLG